MKTYVLTEEQMQAVIKALEDAIRTNSNWYNEGAIGMLRSIPASDDKG